MQQATLPPERDGFASLTLDFDLLFSPEPEATDAYVWDSLEKARHMKNELFVDSLTKEFLETFK